MLKDLTSENLIRLNIEATDWEDAVRKAAQPLLEAGKVKQSYIDDIIVGAKESGPYFVLAQHVALPHARPEAGALESAIGVATLATPVEFGSEANDPVKYLFCLSARNNTELLTPWQIWPRDWKTRSSSKCWIRQPTRKRFWIT